MTKKIRIENADTSNFRAQVRVMDKAAEPGEADVLVTVVPLDHFMVVAEQYITSTRYLVVEELPPA